MPAKATQKEFTGRSVHRYKRGKNILREAVAALEKQNPTKILPLTKKEKAPTLGKCLKIKSGDEGVRTPDVCIANAQFHFRQNALNIAN
jgi:hypothetical protein